MIKIDFKQHILPHVIAVIVFLVITIAFFSPVFFDGKELSQHDILQFRGGAQEAVAYRTQNGEEAFWTNSMFGGMPTYLNGLQFKEPVLMFFQNLLYFWLPSPAGIIFSAMLCFYILLLVYGVRPYLAIGGAIAFALSSFNLISIDAGHNAKVRAIAYMPLVLAGFHLMFKKRYLWAFILTAIGLALEIRVNHLQITYYLAIALSIYGLSELYFYLKDKQLTSFIRAAGLLIAAVLIAVGANFAKLWGMSHYSRYSTRGASELVSEKKDGKSGLDRDYVFRWSNGIAEPLTLLIPNFFGGATQEALDEKSTVAESLRRQGATRVQVAQQIQAMPTYWGDQPFTAGPAYAGAIIILLFALGALVADKRHSRWILAATIFFIVLSWGKNFELFNYLMYDYFPGYAKFRSVSMAICIPLVLMPLLGMLGLEKLLENRLESKLQKKALYAIAGVGGFCLLMAIGAGMLSFRGPVDAQLPDWLLSSLRTDRKAMLSADAWRSFFLIIAFAGLFYFFIKNKINSTIAYTLAALLITIDLWAVGKRHLNADDYSKNASRNYFAATEADQYILQQNNNHARVLNILNPWNEAKTSYLHASVGGYHGAKMKIYQELIDHCLGEETNELLNRLRSGERNMQDLNLINMLNTGYILAGNSRGAVIKNSNAYGNAWWVSNIREVSSAREEMDATCAENLKQNAIINTAKFKVAKKPLSTAGDIRLVRYSPNKLVYETDNSGDGLAVFSEIYYPEWSAKIDGVEVEIKKANYVLRALEVPAGKHTIEFMINLQPYEKGNWISQIFGFVLAAMLIFGLVGTFRKKY